MWLISMTLFFIDLYINDMHRAELLRQKRRKSAHLTKYNSVSPSSYWIRKRQRQREVEQLKALFANKTEEEIEQIREQVRKESKINTNFLCCRGAEAERIRGVAYQGPKNLHRC